MGTHSSILAWRILWTEEPGGLWFMGLQSVGHTFTCTFHLHCVRFYKYSRDDLKYTGICAYIICKYYIPFYIKDLSILGF